MSSTLLSEVGLSCWLKAFKRFMRICSRRDYYFSGTLVHLTQFLNSPSESFEGIFLPRVLDYNSASLSAK